MEEVYKKIGTEEDEEWRERKAPNSKEFEYRLDFYMPPPGFRLREEMAISGHTTIGLETLPQAPLPHTPRAYCTRGRSA